MSKPSSNEEKAKLSSSPFPQPDVVFEIPAEGSLGLLALGYRGLIAWREKRAALTKKEKKQNG